MNAQTPPDAIRQHAKLIGVRDPRLAESCWQMAWLWAEGKAKTTRRCEHFAAAVSMYACYLMRISTSGDCEAAQSEAFCAYELIVIADGVENAHG